MTDQTTTEIAAERFDQTSTAVQGKVAEARDTVQQRVRDQVDTRSTQAGEQVAGVSQAMHNVGEQLRSQGQDLPADLAQRAAAKTESLARYLKESGSDRIIADVEDFGRRQPWLMAAIGVAVGMAASRFLKASSRRRYSGGVRGVH